MATKVQSNHEGSRKVHGVRQRVNHRFLWTRIIYLSSKGNSLVIQEVDSPNGVFEPHDCDNTTCPLLTRQANRSPFRDQFGLLTPYETHLYEINWVDAFVQTEARGEHPLHRPTA